MSEVYRVKFVVDTDAEFEECNGESRPLTAKEYADNEYMEGGKPMPYARYLAYYGNPERHVYLGCIVEKRCHCCGSWSDAASVWSIDLMDDSPELSGVTLDHYYSPTDALKLPGYLSDVAQEELTEAGYSTEAA